MRQLTFIIVLLISLYSIGISQSASDYFPGNEGYEWFYNVYYLDADDNPVDSIDLMEAKKFTGSGEYYGEDSKVVLSKLAPSYLLNSIPYVDSTFNHFEGATAYQYVPLLEEIDTSMIPDSVEELFLFVENFSGWYPTFQFDRNVGESYQLLQVDTTVTYNDEEIPLRFKIVGEREADEELSIEIGDYYCKKFTIRMLIQYLIHQPPLPPIPITIWEVPQSYWLSTGSWVIKEFRPTVDIDLSEIEGPVIEFPGMEKVLTDSLPSGAASEIDINEDWNLVSVPVIKDDMTVEAIFPSASSSAFAYSNGYQQVTELQNKQGYWLKFEEDTTYMIEGEKVTGTIPVNEGWNIVGPYEIEIPVSSINTQPENILASEFFGFNGSYNIPENLQPGKGYWIKVSQDGELLLNSKKENIRASANKFVSSNAESSVTIEDNAGNSSSLYFSGNSESVNKAIMPPVPPEGSFDVRFSSNKFIAEHNSQFKKIEINTDNYPVKLTSNNIDLIVVYNNGTERYEKSLADDETVTITDPQIKSVNVKSKAAPQRFALLQNYPNPFNPSTIIEFKLAKKSEVKLTVYNILGERVKTLTSGELSAGSHKVKFDAGNNWSSGIYFYKLEINNSRIITKKMILLR